MRSYAHLSSSFSLNMAWCLQTSACSFLFLGSPWMKVCCIKSITWTCNSIKQIYGFVKHQYSDNIRLFVSSSIRAFNSTTFHWEQQSCATLVRLILVSSSVQEAWEFSVCSIYCVLQQLCLTIAKLIPSVRSKGSQIVSKPSNDSSQMQNWYTFFWVELNFKSVSESSEYFVKRLQYSIVTSRETRYMLFIN